MPEQPIVANGQIDIVYVVGLTEHVAQWRCVIDNPAGGGPYNVNVLGGGSIPWTDAVDQAVALLVDLFHTSTAISEARLQHYDDGIYITLDNYSVGESGTQSAASQPTSQQTYTFKDTTNKLVKVVLLGGVEVPPYRDNYAQLNAAQQALVDDLLDGTAGKLGAWFTGRSENQLRRFIAVTVSINKKLQRKLGLG